MRVVLRFSAVCLGAATGLLSQMGPWANVVPFDASNAAQVWAITASFRGQISSDGSALDVSVESARLERPERFDSPAEISEIDVYLTRNAPGGQWYQIKNGMPRPLHQTLTAGRSVELAPFRIRIPLEKLQLLKADHLTIGLRNSVLRDGRRSEGFVYVQVDGGFPVSQEATAYCADEVTDLTVSPGKTTGFQVLVFCRDSAGRTRTEHSYRSTEPGPNASTSPSSIEITDPVADFIYLLSPRNQTGTRRKGYRIGAVFGGIIGGIAGGLPTAPPPPPPGQARANLPPQPKTSTQFRGVKTMEGVEVWGTVRTTVYPAGYQGRAEEVTVSNETWYSPVLGTTVMSVGKDPRSTDSHFHLENIRVGEPDAGLFAVPAGYQIADR